MDDQRTNRKGGGLGWDNLSKLAVIVVVGVIVAWIIFAIWLGSERELWSSDHWTLDTANVIAKWGPFALMLLAFLLWWRRK